MAKGQFIAVIRDPVSVRSKNRGRIRRLRELVSVNECLGDWLVLMLLLVLCDYWSWGDYGIDATSDLGATSDLDAIIRLSVTTGIDATTGLVRLLVLGRPLKDKRTEDTLFS